MNEINRKISAIGRHLSHELRYWIPGRRGSTTWKQKGKKVSNLCSPCSWCFILRQFTMIQIQWEGNINKWKVLSHQGERDRSSGTLRLHQFIGKELKRKDSRGKWTLERTSLRTAHGSATGCAHGTTEIDMQWRCLKKRELPVCWVVKSLPGLTDCWKASSQSQMVSLTTADHKRGHTGDETICL